MSWITDLAGKAEHLLNKIDSEAKTVLHERRGSTASEPGSSGKLLASSSVPSDLSSYGISGTPSSESSASSIVTAIPGISSGSSLTSSPKSRLGNIRTKKNVGGDASLMQFLNNDIPPDTQNSNSRDGTRTPSHEVVLVADVGSHSRQSSVSSMSSYLALSGRNTPGFTNLDVETGSSGSASGSSTHTDAYITMEGPSDISAPSSHGSSTSPPVMVSLGGSPASSTGDGESEMLKKELSSLNQEMSQVLRRAKEAEKEAKALRAETADVRGQKSASETLMRQIQQREIDLQESLNAKDSQLAVLRVRLQEADQNVSSHSAAVEQMKVENARLLEGATASSGIHTQAIHTIEERLNDTRVTLERERDLHKTNYAEMTRRVNQLEEEQQGMASSVAEAQRKLQNEKDRSQKLDSQIASLKGELVVSRDELFDYKSKAGRILQSKEKLITNLKEGRTEGDIKGDTFIQEELDQIRCERDLLREELEGTGSRVKHLTSELNELEMSSQNEARANSESFISLENDLANERTAKGQAEEETKHTKEELRCTHEELTRQKINISTKLQERDSEIHRLQKQIAHRQSSSSSQNELENRLRGLTESLIHKQTSIETLGTERQSLMIQMERLQGQYKESQDMLNRDQPIFHQDEVRNRIPTFMMESPFDGGVARRVKNVYSTLDKFSVRLGVFLRRYPIARVFVILYMFLLHVWVMIVLLTYTPEVHGPEFRSMGTAPQHPMGII